MVAQKKIYLNVATAKSCSTIPTGFNIIKREEMINTGLDYA